MARLRTFFFENLWHNLAAFVGLMQVLIGHWVIVVLAGREGPGLALGLGLAALLVAANVSVVPVIRDARRRGRGLSAWMARLYTSVSIGTLLVGTVIALGWLGFLPLAGLLAAVGISSELVFDAFRVLSAGVVAMLVAILVWGFTIGQRRFEHTHLRLPLSALPDGLRGLRIVQISDLHIGNGLEDERLGAFVARVNALDADVLAITGDIFDFDPRHVDDGARRLGGLRARHGVYAVLGNHDAYTGSELVAAALERHAPHIRLLRGDVERLPTEHPIYLAGIDDPGRHWTAQSLKLPELEALASGLPEDGPVLLLVHRPEAFPQAARLGFPLVLAGHTHGGQLALPTPGGRLNVARFMTRFHRGLYRQGEATLYVHRGCGVAGPALRINCPREIATIELI